MPEPTRPLPDDLRDAVAALARTGHVARVVALTGSTNDDARAWASASALEGGPSSAPSRAPTGAIVIADAQSSGRGRHGRVWSSPSGASLAMSIVLRPAVVPARLPPLALVVGLAVRRAIAGRVSSRVLLKWPNDVVVASDDPTAPAFGKKVAGVLVEAAIGSHGVEHAIVGVGINVARSSFPEELTSVATSLSLLGATSLSRTELAVDLITALDEEVRAWLQNPESLADRLSAHDALRGLRVRLEGGELGVGDGFSEDGRLRVRRDDGSTIAALAGEVTVIASPKEETS